MKFLQAKNYTKANRLAIDLIVIHTAECGETPQADDNVAGYFAGAQAPQASAHYVVDADSVTQCVLEKDVAWHAGPVNGFSIGIEHAGYASQTPEQWDDQYSIELLARSAELVASLCKRYDIPVVRLTAADLKAGKRNGLCGHVDVTNGLTGGVGHYDPGPNFPWDEYLDMVRANMKPQEPTEWVRVGDWLVAPTYVAPVGIGEAVTIAERHGYELPTPDLVDQIWSAADLKLLPQPRKNDGTPATMSTPEVYADQAKAIETQIAGRSFKLLAGSHKDVCIQNGRVGLYGWHYPNGKVIQPFFAGHAMDYKDYSQGLRLVKRVGPDLTTVRGIQTRLAALGFDPGPLDGKPGPKTMAAVKAFQTAKGLVSDGIVGPKTLAALAT